MGLQFKNIHDVSKIIIRFLEGNNIEIDKKKIEILNQIAQTAKKIEEEKSATRYGVLKNETLITPEERYNSKNTLEYLRDFSTILTLSYRLLSDLPDFEKIFKKFRPITTN